MRALLLHNPNATTTTPAVVDRIARMIASELKLDVEATKRRDHAGFLAAGAAHEGYEVVFALGGDGTVNEVVQGVANTDVTLAVIPGGSTNVWVRSLGLPNDAVAATRILLDKLAQRADRLVNLGAANERYFAFTAGFGFDADVVRQVERRYRLKRSVRQASFLWCALVAYYTSYDRKGTDITVAAGTGTPVSGLRSVVCCNSNPFTYLGRRPAQLCPNADLDGALSLIGLSKLSLPAIAQVARAALTSSAVGKLSFARFWDDEATVDLRSNIALPLQVDGDFVGATQTVKLRSVPRALRVVS